MGSVTGHASAKRSGVGVVGPRLSRMSSIAAKHVRDECRDNTETPYRYIFFISSVR